MNSYPPVTISGARQHNLQSIDLEIPNGKITVITGRSGSGKSTLAIDILFAEGQHLYLQSVGADNLSGKRLWPRPDVDSILHLPPPVALQQASTLSSKNPNSTVATLTGLKRLARMLYATAATVECPQCRIPLRAQGIDEITAELEALDPGSRVILLAPVTTLFRQMPPDEAIAMLQGQGFLRIKIDDQQFYTDQKLKMPENWNRAEIIIDRLVIKPGISARLNDSVRLALKAGNGILFAEIIKNSCQTSAPSPRDAKRLAFTEKTVCPGCSREFPDPTPELFSMADIYRQESRPVPNGFSSVKEAREFVNSASIQGLSWIDFFQADFSHLKGWTDELAATLNRSDNTSPATSNRLAALRIADAISGTVKYACDMGISYLTPSRSLATLSHGELQRLRLGAQLGRNMTGILYILDEPTSGLHPLERASLYRNIKRLRKAGNTILIIEHDTTIMEQADHIIELGPGAGDNGGRVIFTGCPRDLAEYPGGSITGPWLAGKRNLSRRAHGHERAGWIRLEIPSRHILQKGVLKIPRQSLTCLTGLSGSGKTLLLETVINMAEKERESKQNRLPGTVLVKQNPVTRTSASFPATYMKIFSHIRGMFARTPEARKRGLGAGWFSLAKRGGRCEHCKGRGTVTSDLGFLPPVSSPCGICKGRRYNRDAMTIRYRGSSISDVLDMSATEAIGFFMHLGSVRKPLEWMERTGLGYLKLGQAISTMSGGELQRLKLARELARPACAETLYLFDEPTLGLHLEDIAMLITIVDDLLERGNSIIMAANDPRIVAVADWIIELGPGAGPEGGRITFQGTAAELASLETSPTAPFIRQFLK